jgi:hypothetical protein
MTRSLDWMACANLNITQHDKVYPSTVRFPIRYGSQAMGPVKWLGLLVAG